MAILKRTGEYVNGMAVFKSVDKDGYMGTDKEYLFAEIQGGLTYIGPKNHSDSIEDEAI